MKSIADFFEKFKNILSSDVYIKEAVVLAIKTIAHFDVDRKNIVIKNNIASLKIENLEKIEVFMRKDKIIEEINKNLPKNLIIDIR